MAAKKQKSKKTSATKKTANSIKQKPDAPKKTATSKKQKLGSAARKPTRDLYFNPADLQETLQEGFSGTVDLNASVFLVGIMQYVATELLEISANIARGRTGHRHTAVIEADVRKAVQVDKEFRLTFNDVYREAMDRGELTMPSISEK